MSPLGSPDLSAMAPAAVSPQPDRAPDSLAGGTPEALRSDLIALLGLDRVLARAIDLIRYATDASPYRLFPKVVVVAQDTDDVRKVLAYAGQRHESVTFRAAGTSLSGQAQGDGILVDVRRHWSGVEVEAGGRRLRARPGTILSRGNAALVPYGYRIGPDPASASALHDRRRNRQQLERNVLRDDPELLQDAVVAHVHAPLRYDDRHEPSGCRYSSSPQPSRRSPAGLVEIKRDDRIGSGPCRSPAQEVQHQEHDRLPHGGIPRWRDAVRDLPPVDRGIRRDAGLHRRSGLRHDSRRSVSAHLVHDLSRHVRGMCGREALRRQRRGRRGAARSRVAARRRRQARRARCAGRRCPIPRPHCWSSTELRARSLGRKPCASARETLSGLALLEPAAFTKDPKLAAQFWNVRSGLLPSVGGARPPGSSFILEDVCFPPERLADGALDLAALFAKHDYAGVVFGHASAGNLHFLITPFLNDAKDIAHFGRFMQDVVELVVGKYDGSLKAEHGTGRNVAPFVEREWGPKLTGLMRNLKRLADPQNILVTGGHPHRRSR